MLTQPDRVLGLEPVRSLGLVRGELGWYVVGCAGGEHLLPRTRWAPSSWEALDAAEVWLGYLVDREGCEVALGGGSR